MFGIAGQKAAVTIIAAASKHHKCTASCRITGTELSKVIPQPSITQIQHIVMLDLKVVGFGQAPQPSERQNCRST